MGLGFVEYWVWSICHWLQMFWELGGDLPSAGHGAENWWAWALLPVPQGWAIRDLSSRLAARFLGHWGVLVVLFSFCISVPSRDLYSPVVPSFRREAPFCHWGGSECLRISLWSPTGASRLWFLSPWSFSVFLPHLQILVIKSPDSLQWTPLVCMFNPQFLVVENLGRLGGCFMNIPSSLSS